jgi:peptide/nickel transport system substrate-binding protein
VSEDKKVFTFKIRKGVRFHDGTRLTSKDIKASFEHFISPQPGIISPRKAFYSAVEKIEVPDEYTIIFRLKHTSANFLGRLASPFNWVYSAERLAKDPHWYEKNINGTGPFKFVEHVAGSHWSAKKNEDYFIKGLPYLDGYQVLIIKSDSGRLNAIRSGRAHAEFRFFGPTQRDDLVKAMGSDVTVQEATPFSGLSAVISTKKKPFDDPRFRRALALSLDRYEGSKAMEKISSMKWVGGLLSPGSQLAMTPEELSKVAGFHKDIDASRAEARRLLKESGISEGFGFSLMNRSQEGQYGQAGIWLIDQWRKTGLNVQQKIVDDATYQKALSSGDYEVAINWISDFMDDPSLQFARFISVDKSEANYGHYIDRELDELYDQQDKAWDTAERKKLCDRFQVRVLDEMAYAFPIFWSHRITLHSSKMKGWKALPSHLLGMDLAGVWLSKE